MFRFKRRHIEFILLCTILYFPLFLHLEDWPIRLWDESRLAINAFEMWKNGDYIVTHFDQQPDMWNTKPPLLIWLQSGLMHIFGMRELSIRLPSALAAFFTCIAMYVLITKYTKKHGLGIISALVLITIPGYVTEHVARTGDYDALLILFTTTSGLLFFIIVESKKYKYFILLFFLLALSVLTKSIAGLMFTPAYVIYALMRRQVIPILKSKYFYIGIAIFLFITVGYYLLRDAFNPGYLMAVWENDMGGRFNEGLGDIQYNFWYYFTRNYHSELSPWFYAVPIGFALGIFNKNNRLVRLTTFVSIMVVVFFLIISKAQTKLEWYDAPLYPFLAILIAMGIYFIYELLRDSHILKGKMRMSAIPYIFLFIIFIKPYQIQVKESLYPTEKAWRGDSFDITYFLQNCTKGYYDVHGYGLLYDGYHAHNAYYLHYLNEIGIRIQFYDWENLKTGDKVIVQQRKIINFLKSHYKLKLIKQMGNVFLYEIV